LTFSDIGIYSLSFRLIKGASRGVFDARAGSGGCGWSVTHFISQRLKSQGSGEPAARHRTFLGGPVSARANA